MINEQELILSSLNKYITGSSVDLCKYFEGIEPFVDLIVTSPPYWDMKQYGEVNEQTGHGQSYDEYLDDIQRTFEGVHRISKDSVSLFLIVDTMKRNGKMVRLPDDIADRLEEVGWVHQDTIIWDKGKTLPWSRKGQMRNVFEYVLMFTKKGSISYKYYIDRIKSVDELKEWWIDYPERYSPQGKVPDNIWEFYIPTQGSWGTKKDFGDDEFKHACPFSPEMMARIILLSTDENDVVFDPYAGTGVMLATATKMNRKYLGFDTNPDYKRVFENVTKPLVDEKWIEIESYYSLQEQLKVRMEEAIYKLRILKYQKALIKRIRNLSNNNSDMVKNDFLLNIAIEQFLEESEKGKFILGKVKYYMIWNNEETLEMARKQVEGIISKAPFTKYGLIVDLKIILKNELDLIISEIDDELYAYLNGITNSYHSTVRVSDFIKKINSVEYNMFFDKDVPPLLSNVKIHEDDYNMLPAEKYEKKGYSKELEHMQLALNLR
ncbi:site-specific DNA-methyltransferase [Brevibacillus laterosporus]|nr:site-specific DNA-methyltransferase [Brevibacillus laterosporus]TPG83667.1 site-specific DNA-methyltransferase [Brevibacillus laterosporus]